MKRHLLIFSMAAFAAVSSCSFLHDDKPVAKVGVKVLYRSELLSHIPGGLSPKDSAAMAENYINAWASELIINEMADIQLSPSEKDVSRELEEYRSSLLKYRYEQHYIQERLDTAVSEEQIRSAYNSNPSAYALSFPILKARYACFHHSDRLHDSMLDMLRADSEGGMQLLDSLSRTMVSKYTDFDGQWVDIVTLARLYGMDYGTLVSAMKKSFIDIVDNQGDNHIAYVISYIPVGEIPPMEYCRDRIREVIISQRKHALMATLERDLLENALSKGKFVVYENDEK